MMFAHMISWHRSQRLHHQMLQFMRGVCRGRGRFAVAVTAGVFAVAAHSTALGQASSSPLDQLDAPVGGSSADSFGISIAVTSDVCAVGAPGWNVPSGGTVAAAQGIVHVYKYFGSGIFQWQNNLTLPTGVANDNTGASVAASNGWIVAGVPGREITTGGTPPIQLQAGLACVWKRSGTGWSPIPYELSHQAPKSIDLFGSAVAIQERLVSGQNHATIAVGAPTDDDGTRIDAGSVTLFDWSPSTGRWVQTAFIVPPTIGSENPQLAASGIFGTAVELSGDFLIVGAKRQTVSVSKQGTAFVFRRNTLDNPAPTILATNPSWGEWCLVQRLVGGAPVIDELFGSSIGASPWGVIIGAPSATDSAGSATIFELESSTGTFELKGHLTATIGQLGDRFGASVALVADLAVIGAAGVEVTSPIAVANRGSAWVFGREPGICGAWTERTRFVPFANANVADANFGASIAVAPDTVLVGAPRASNQMLAQGNVYSFNIDSTECPPDLNGDTVIDAADVILLLTSWGASGSQVADINGDLFVDAKDLIYILAHWGSCACN
ncbi:MAG: hypothetical protein EXS15_00460 [Phycisphaerales bacterium]|nr:hypothetical protein [Phycisphaerales bacterium]